MFVEDIFVINDEEIDFDFLDSFSIGQYMVMQQLIRVELENNDEVNNIRFVTGEAVRNSLFEENKRNIREDRRFNSNIVRDDLVVNIKTSMSMLIENMAGLAGRANDVALSNINWNPNEPFVLLNRIFENIVVGWKETLVTALVNRHLRINGLKSLIMKNENNNCRTVDILETVVNRNRGNQNLITQVLEINGRSRPFLKVHNRGCQRDLISAV
jgi:hypothetical protein